MTSRAFILLVIVGAGGVARAQPKTARHLYLAGKIAVDEGRLDAALDALLRAVELAPASVAVRYELALASERRGDHARAAEQLRWCARLGLNDRGLEPAIAALDNGEPVDLTTLSVAANMPGPVDVEEAPPSGESPLREQGRKELTAGAVLLPVGLLLAGISPLLILNGYNDNGGNGFGAVNGLGAFLAAVGTAGYVSAVPLLIAGGVHRAKGRPRVPTLVTRELLPKAIERARSGAIGAGIATAVTAALVAASVGLYVNAEESLAPTHYSPAVQQQAAAGVALLSLSVVALNVSVSVLASELGNLGSLRRTARRLTAASIAPKPLPWVSRDAGGIALAGRF